VARAFVAEQGGEEPTVAKYGEQVERLSKWEALKFGVRATPKASRVAGFIVMWSVAMQLEGKEEFSITEYQRYWREGERQAYRLQREFRELWPEFETPNELASQIAKHVDAELSRREIVALPARIQVLAA
jgi:hypothetical protein